MTQIPFRSSPKFVLPEWIDYNGHLNMAFYHVLFDNGLEEAYSEIGFGQDYINEHGFTTYIAEFHIRYLRELHEGDEVTITTQLIDYDEKRFHTYQELFHKDGWLAATGEALALHIDMSGPHVAPMPPQILKNLKRMKEAHAALKHPDGVGSSISIRK